MRLLRETSQPSWQRRCVRAATAFARSRHGAAMLVSGAFAISVLLGVGAAMSNYAWREAQIEEASNALRAAISAAAQLLQGWSGDQSNADAQQIRERVAQFLEGVVPGMDVEDSDVTVELLDPLTREVRVTVAGDYAMDNVWGPSNPTLTGGGLSLAQTVAVDASRYEVAIAADLTRSMNQNIRDADGNSVGTKLDALKAAMEVAANVVDTMSVHSPGTMLVSVVPFGSAVRIADTSRAGRTPGKERYVRLLAGADAGSAAARSTSGHWVDTFHAYGTGTSMGPLAQRNLPAAYLTNGAQDWEMNGAKSIDVSNQVPALGTWDVDDQDFWNGCVMARWGAYWDALARPGGWTPNDASNWPAKSDVSQWSSGGWALSGAPLHLSDEPPDSGKPSTRFTAYSWPDARISATTDARLHAVLAETLAPGALDGSQINKLDDTVAHNDWSLPVSSGGDELCPDSPLVPLMEDPSALRATIAQLDTVPLHDGFGLTFLHLGVVWGLRTLSPFWQDIWQTSDAQSPPLRRPALSCAPGDVPSSENCNPHLQKSILLITDGESYFGDGWTMASSRSTQKLSGHRNPEFSSYLGICNSMSTKAGQPYDEAMSKPDAFAFNSWFSTMVPLDATYRFMASDLTRLLDAFDKVIGPPTGSGVRRSQALIGMTPWELFRGDGFRQDRTSVVDDLVDPINEFGLDGRPVHNNVCRWASFFSPYGQLDDLVNVGDRPVTGVAPLAMDPGWRTLSVRDVDDAVVSNRFDRWLEDACIYAGLRRVRVNAIYVGPRTSTANIQRLEDCVDLAGGDPTVDEVFVTPTATELTAAFEELFVVRRKLRFLN